MVEMLDKEGRHRYNICDGLHAFVNIPIACSVAKLVTRIGGSFVLNLLFVRDIQCPVPVG